MTFRIYVEMNLVFVAVTLVMLRGLLRPGRTNRRYKLFANLLLCCIAAFVMDIFWAYVALGLCPTRPWVKFAVYCLYFLTLYSVGFSWFRYCDFCLGSPLLRGEGKLLRYSIPYLVIAVLLITSYWTHLVVYVDADGVYHKGPFFAVHALGMCGYIVLAAYCTIRSAVLSRGDLFRDEYLGMLLFGAYPFLGVLMQMIFPAFPVICAGIIIGVVRVFADLMDRQISVDELTKLNNRNRLNVYFSGRAKAIEHSDRLLYLILIDVDHFKSINDRYGHNAGDRALVDVAEHLKALGRRYPCFLSRYGGDEFIILLEADTPQMLDDLLDDLRSLSAPSESRQGRPYAISLSIGWSQFSPQVASLQKLIHIADQNMYAEKRRKREEAN